jgi:hypothetical protein
MQRRKGKRKKHAHRLLGAVRFMLHVCKQTSAYSLSILSPVKSMTNKRV